MFVPEAATTMTTADRGFTWSDQETSLLLELWGANDAQSELTGNKRNFPVYEKISESMISMGYMRTASQCREKIKRMKREYALAKQQHSDKRNGSRKNMRFFEQFHKILLEKQMRSNAALRSSLKIADSETDARETVPPKRTWDSENKSSDNQLSQNPSSCSEKEDDNAWAPDVLLVEGENQTESLFDHPASPYGTSINSRDISPEKGLSPELPYLKCMMDTLLAKLMKYQTESDARILTKIEELENERTAMDERMTKMWIDFEEKRRNDEQEHELNVMKVFQEIMNQMKEKKENSIAKD